MSSHLRKEKSDIRVVFGADRKHIIAKSTISQDRTHSEQQTLLSALERRPKNINLKGGRFEAGVGKKDQAKAERKSSAAGGKFDKKDIEV
jgi:hypothetical protein